MLAENVLWHLNLRSRRPENNLDGTRADRPGTRPLAGGHGRDPAGRGPRGPRGGVGRQRRAPGPREGPQGILLDPMLPHRSRYELYASLPRGPATPAIP